MSVDIRQEYPIQWTAANAPWLLGLAFAAPLIAVSKRWPSTLHAVDMDGVFDGTFGRGTFAAACGVTGLRLWGQPVDERMVAALWPPRLAGTPVQFSRCRDCWLATGRMRPRTEWRTS
jgi:hypothetical protein